MIAYTLFIIMASAISIKILNVSIEYHNLLHPFNEVNALFHIY
jgi:hypothetical protein